MNVFLRYAACMPRNVVLRRGALFALAVLGILTLAQSAALAGLCEEDHLPNHSCLLCQTGALPLLQAAVSLPAAPSLLIDRLASSNCVAAAHDLLLTASSPRAPPVANRIAAF